MKISVATVRDTQSAEYLKSLALAEADPLVAHGLLDAARELDPESTTLICHQGLGLFQLERHADVIALGAEYFPRYPRLIHLANLYAASLCHIGHLSLSEQLLKYVLTLDPDYPNAEASVRQIRANRQHDVAAPAVHVDAVKNGLALARLMPVPSLAVCMIVKDEAEFIVGAIESVTSVADEVIVVDTGSTDDTVALSEKAGARVEYFQWTGDFSEARNISVEHAKSDWILILDADERLTEASKTSLRAVLQEYHTDEERRVICVRINNYTRDGDFIGDGFSGRLFRNWPDMRFEGRVHEEVARDRADVTTDYRLDIEFDHYGADPGVMAEKDKDRRNIELLEARLETVPDDLLTWFYLGSQHWVAGRLQEAVDGFRRVTEYYQRDPSRYGVAIRNVTVAYSYVGLVRGLLRLGQFEEGSDVAYRGRDLFPDNPDVAFQAGLVEMGREEYVAARELFEQARTITVSGYGLIGMRDRSIQEWRAAKFIADIDFYLDDSQRSYDGYVALLDRIPADFEEWHIIYARLVELAAALRRFVDLPRWTLEYVKRRPTQIATAIQIAQQMAGQGELNQSWALLNLILDALPDVDQSLPFVTALGQVAELSGDDQAAVKWYERSAKLGNQDPSFWLNLAGLFVRNGNDAAAQQAFKAAQTFMSRSGS